MIIAVSQNARKVGEVGMSEQEQLVELKTKEEKKKDIQNEMVWLLAERQRLTIEYREKIRQLDDKYDKLDYKLMSGNY